MLRDLARAMGASDSGIQKAKRTLAAKFLEFMGNDILVEVWRAPQWRCNLDANRERAACRHERLAA